MKALDIDFTGRARRHRTWCFRAAVAALLSLTAYYGAFAVTLYLEAERFSAQTALVQQDIQTLEVERARPPASPAYAADAASAATLASYRWDNLLTGIELVQMPGVSAKRLVVDAAKAQADLELEYSGLEPLNAYYSQLVASQPAWRLVKAAGGAAQLQLMQSDIPAPVAPARAPDSTAASAPTASGDAVTLTRPPPIPPPPSGDTRR